MGGIDGLAGCAGIAPGARTPGRGYLNGEVIRADGAPGIR